MPIDGMNRYVYTNKQICKFLRLYATYANSNIHSLSSTNIKILYFRRNESKKNWRRKTIFKNEHIWKSSNFKLPISLQTQITLSKAPKEWNKKSHRNYCIRCYDVYILVWALSRHCECVKWALVSLAERLNKLYERKIRMFFLRFSFREMCLQMAYSQMIWRRINYVKDIENS